MSKWTDWIEAGCAVVNVGVVVTLARLNYFYFYLKAAERSAEAAKSQANAMQESLPALQRTQALDIENERVEMRRVVNEMLIHVGGLKDNLEKLRGAGFVTPIRT
jgi:hypothetical protein